MRVPLRYQATAYSCGSTSLVNALSYLFGREELPPEIITRIYGVTLDRYHGIQGTKGGTSSAAMAFVSEYLNHFGVATGFPVAAVHVRDELVSLDAGSPIVRWIDAGGVAVLSCLYGVDHYVLATGVERDAAGEVGRVRVFDPWYHARPEDAFAPGAELEGVDPADVEFVDDLPLECNRVIAARLFRSPEKGPYSFVCNTPKEALLVRRTDR